VPRRGTGIPVSGAVIARGAPKERTVIRPVDVELGVDVKLSSLVVGVPALSFMKALARGVAGELGAPREADG
jgi:hypothetical protein